MQKKSASQESNIDKKFDKLSSALKKNLSRRKEVAQAKKPLIKKSSTTQETPTDLGAYQPVEYSLYIGLMSGTSLDGIDASLIKTDGQNQFSVIENLHLAYSREFKAKLKSLFSCDKEFLEIEKEFTKLHVEATLGLMQKSKISYEDIKAIGFHGQTIFHDPTRGLTWQIGNPHLLATQTAINVVHDFRRRDIALGGQGAPLVPIFHKLMARNKSTPIAVLNIGGVANITYIEDETIIAFDTGPGNALIDDVCLKYFNHSFDDMGQYASCGTVDHEIVQNFILNEYFQQDYPKSIDRNHFYDLKQQLSEHKPVDQIATLTYITSITIVKAVKLLPKIPSEILICGGGVHNLQMVKWIQELCTNEALVVEFKSSSELDGFDPNFIESQAFAYLAARFVQNIPSAFPTTTGCIVANVCGCLVMPGPKTLL